MFHKFVIIIISGWVLASFWGFRPMLSNTSYAKHQYWQRHCWMASSGAPTRPRLPWLPPIKSVFSQSKLFKNSKSLSLSIETFCKTHITYHHITLATFLFPRMACDQWFTTWSIWCKTWMSLRCSPERWSALSSSSTLAQSCTPFWHLSWTFSGRISFLGHQIILYKSIKIHSLLFDTDLTQILWTVGFSPSVDAISGSKAMRSFFFDRLLTLISFIIYLLATCCFAALWKVPFSGVLGIPEFSPTKRLTKFNVHTKNSKRNIEPFWHRLLDLCTGRNSSQPRKIERGTWGSGFKMIKLQLQKAQVSSINEPWLRSHRDVA